jgi:uncharacterized protein (DUF2249 family)
MSQANDCSIDVRQIPPWDRHPLIFGRFHALQPGEMLEIVNDHDPRPLYFQLKAQAPESFTWTYVESGPEVWRVNINKTKATSMPRAASEGSCCSGGNCG